MRPVRLGIVAGRQQLRPGFEQKRRVASHRVAVVDETEGGTVDRQRGVRGRLSQFVEQRVADRFDVGDPDPAVAVDVDRDVEVDVVRGDPEPERDPIQVRPIDPPAAVDVAGQKIERHLVPAAPRSVARRLPRDCRGIAVQCGTGGVRHRIIDDQPVTSVRQAGRQRRPPIGSRINGGKIGVRHPTRLVIQTDRTPRHVDVAVEADRDRVDRGVGYARRRCGIQRDPGTSTGEAVTDSDVQDPGIPRPDRRDVIFDFAVDRESVRVQPPGGGQAKSRHGGIDRRSAGQLQVQTLNPVDVDTGRRCQAFVFGQIAVPVEVQPSVQPTAEGGEDFHRPCPARRGFVQKGDAVFVGDERPVIGVGRSRRLVSAVGVHLGPQPRTADQVGRTGFDLPADPPAVQRPTNRTRRTAVGGDRHRIKRSIDDGERGRRTELTVVESVERIGPKRHLVGSGGGVTNFQQDIDPITVGDVRGPSGEVQGDGVSATRQGPTPPDGTDLQRRRSARSERYRESFRRGDAATAEIIDPQRHPVVPRVAGVVAPNRPADRQRDRVVAHTENDLRCDRRFEHEIRSDGFERGIAEIDRHPRRVDVIVEERFQVGPVDVAVTVDVRGRIELLVVRGDHPPHRRDVVGVTVAVEIDIAQPRAEDRRREQTTESLDVGVAGDFAGDHGDGVVAVTQAAEAVDEFVAVGCPGGVGFVDIREDRRVVQPGGQVQKDVHLLRGPIGRSNDQVAVLVDSRLPGFERDDLRFRRQPVDVNAFPVLGEHGRAAVGPMTEGT